MGTSPTESETTHDVWQRSLFMDVWSVRPKAKGGYVHPVVRFVSSFLVTVLAFFGLLLTIGRTGRLGGVEVLFILPVAVLVGGYTWRRLGRPASAEVDHKM